MRFLLISIIFFYGCNSNYESTEQVSPGTDVQYARGFLLDKTGNITKLTITKPFQGASAPLVYYLVPKDLQAPDTLTGKIIRTPVNEIVVTSTSHIPMLDYLHETNTLTGFPTLDYISSPKMRSRIDSGMVEELGRDNKLNFEVLVKLQPELLMTYMLTGDRNQHQRIEQAGIPVLINADYLEQHPLGRAEWIKVAGALFDKSRMADSIFNEIAKNYLNLQTKAAKVTEKPTVFTGIMYGDTWYLPGGNNYSANLFEDAGMNYLWSDNKEHGFLELSFETVYSQAKSADLWIGVASFNTFDELNNADSRYSWFDAYKNENVYTYTARIGPGGGNEYLELGYLRPDFILSDLIQIAHPEIADERNLYFYKKLN